MRLDLVFLAVVAIAFSLEVREGLHLVLLIGILTDSISSAPFGLVTVTYCVAYVGIRMAISTIDLNSVLARFIWTFVASILAIFLKDSLLALIFKNPQFLLLAFSRGAWQSLLNAIVGLAVIPLFNFYLGMSWEKMFKPKGIQVE